MSANSRIISALKAEDDKIASGIRFMVGVPHDVNDGKATWGPISYMHTQDPPIMDKMSYGKILTGSNVQPTVQVTDRDVAVEKEKAWMAQLRDFNNWVGEVFKPEDSPANKEVLSRVYPEWIQQQKDEIENWHDMKKRMETIKLMGAQNKEDLFLLYRLGYPKPGQIEDTALTTQMKDMNAPGLTHQGKGWSAQSAGNFYRGLGNTRQKSLDIQTLSRGPFRYKQDSGVDETVRASGGATLNGFGMLQHLENNVDVQGPTTRYF
jgi:hypothetical protein